MEESLVPKRPREEAQVEEEKGLNFEEDYSSSSKRHNPYNHILSLLDSEEEDSTQDLSPLMTTLQQEITCASKNTLDALLVCPTQENDQNTLTITSLEDNNATTSQVLKEDEESDKERVMKHLLQASDDELGIPNKEDESLDLGEDGFKFNGGDMFSSICDGLLWELEDEAANYYDLLESQLFL